MNEILTALQENRQADQAEHELILFKMKKLKELCNRIENLENENASLKNDLVRIEKRLQLCEIKFKNGSIFNY